MDSTFGDNVVNLQQIVVGGAVVDSSRDFPMIQLQSLSFDLHRRQTHPQRVLFLQLPLQASMSQIPPMDPITFPSGDRWHGRVDDYHRTGLHVPSGAGLLDEDMARFSRYHRQDEFSLSPCIMSHREQLEGFIF